MFCSDFLCLAVVYSKFFFICCFVLYEGILNLALIRGNFYLAIQVLAFPLLENELAWSWRYFRFCRGLRSSFGVADQYCLARVRVANVFLL